MRPTTMWSQVVRTWVWIHLAMAHRILVVMVFTLSPGAQAAITLEARRQAAGLGSSGTQQRRKVRLILDKRRVEAVSEPELAALNCQVARQAAIAVKLLAAIQSASDEAPQVALTVEGVGQAAALPCEYVTRLAIPLMRDSSLQFGYGAPDSPEFETDLAVASVDSKLRTVSSPGSR
jgi:hypothetical protein